ncbi:MAG: hypothetical protein ACI89J_003850, partial [Hyphomicrobiaceae bacterium]
MQYSTVANEVSSQTLGPRDLSEVSLKTNPQSCRLHAMSGLSSVAVIWPKNMLHDARMAGLAKLRRSIRSTDERQLWAVHV